MQVKFFNKPPRHLLNRLDLSTWRGLEVRDHCKFVAFYNDSKQFVGATYLHFRNFTLKDTVPYFNIYIEAFEVSNQHRGCGWATEMWHWILNNHNLYRVELTAMHPAMDGGKALGWWRHLGFRGIPGEGYAMAKVLVRI